MAAGALLVFLTASRELTATLLLRPTGMETLATRLWARTEVLQYSAAAPYAIALVGVSIVPAYLISRRVLDS
jgi:iron(III) transport system permease protein